jgi:hypothetical protein
MKAAAVAARIRMARIVLKRRVIFMHTITKLPCYARIFGILGE